MHLLGYSILWLRAMGTILSRHSTRFGPSSLVESTAPRPPAGTLTRGAQPTPCRLEEGHEGVFRFKN